MLTTLFGLYVSWLFLAFYIVNECTTKATTSEVLRTTVKRTRVLHYNYYMAHYEYASLRTVRDRSSITLLLEVAMSTSTILVNTSLNLKE